MSRIAGDHTEAILGAIEFAANRFAEEPIWRDAVPDVLARLGETSEADRVYIYRNFTGQAGDLRMQLLFEWVAEGVSPTIDDPDNQDWPYGDMLARQVEVLSAGGVIHGPTTELPESERPDLVDEAVVSIAIVPIFVENEWWGYLGFDDCAEPRRWSNLEIGTLRSAAALAGGAILRSRLEQQLHATEERFRTLVEHIPAALYMDKPGEAMETEYVGPQLEPLLGISREAWMHDEEVWQKHIHPDDVDWVVEEYWDHMNGGSTGMVQEYRIIRPDDGRTIWVRDDTTLVRDDRGELVSILGVMFDISRQKEAEKAFEEAQQRYQNLVENIPAVVYLDPVDMTQHTIYVSPQIEDLFGVTAAEYLADVDMWERMVHPDDRERAGDVYERFVAGEDLETDTYRMVRPDGRIVWVQDTAKVIRGAQGEPLFVQGVFTDVTAQKEAELQAAVSQASYRQLVETIPLAVYTESITDDPDYPFYMSPQIKHVSGYVPEDFSDRDFWEAHLYPDDREAVLAEDDRTSETGEPFNMEYRFMAPDGNVIWLHEEALPAVSPEGDPILFGVISNVTAQKEAEHRLSLAQEQYKTLVEGIPAMVYLDPPGESDRSLYVSPQCTDVLGITPETYIADVQAWLHVIHPDDRDRVQEISDDHVETGKPLDVEYRVVHTDGSIRWVNEQAQVLLDEEGKPFLIQGMIFDITDRKEAEEQVAFLAFHDALTRLANRAMFEEMLEPALARARRNDMAVAVMFLDLDKFKEVNDTHGHEIGDELLRQVAHRLQECVRDTDLVARQGGDEFLVLLSDLEPGDEADIAVGRSHAIEVAEVLAERIRNTMRLPFKVGNLELKTSASIGISVFPFDAVDARMLLKHADSAMYESKKSRPGSFALHSVASGDSLTQDSMAWRLRRAVKEQAWDLHYQPVVALADGRITGAEALLRWRRPEGDFIPPSDFIPLAEEMGLLEIIGEWVFEEICRQRIEWRRHGIDLTIGFNLSPRQLWQRDLVERLAMGLRASGLSTDDILIEVAESTAMTDPARTQRVLWGLHEEGFRIAIDDFGTGYSPAARIWNLPVDVLKIDQPLIRDLPNDPQVDAFVSAVIEFAKEHDTIAHAEGIETEEQRRFLVETGCEYGQGYLFSRPLPPSDLTTLYKKGKGQINTLELP